MYGDGDHSAGVRAAAALRDLPTHRETRSLNECVGEMWRLHTDSAARPISEMSLSSRERAGTAEAPTVLEICQATLDAIAAARLRDINAPRALARLDALYASGPVEFYSGNGHAEYPPIVLSRLLASAGDLRGALDAIRRRPYFIGWQPFLAATLVDEAQLAIALGDSTGAVRALAHHLALRTNPDPSLREPTAAARDELARLRGPSR